MTPPMTPPAPAPVRRLSLMGIRGLPAAHGGFETFAARLAPWLVAQGWQVTVYCQEDEIAPLRESLWHGVRRVHIGVGPDTPVNSIVFDWHCIRHAAAERAPLVLTLGYNTALFGLWLRLAGITHVINMDGIEWSRRKWGPVARAWLYLNEWAGALGGSHLVADHPAIATHLATRTAARHISMIPYGTERVTEADAALLAPLGLSPGSFCTLIARPEPENSVLEIVRAFSRRPRGCRLVVLGRYEPATVPFHAAVQAAASDEVLFPGAIYDEATVAALRVHGRFYLHGHQVGGTNPSLLEAMGAGNAVIAHDNRFNRWVAGAGARYFRDEDGCAAAIEALLADPAEARALGQANLAAAATRFDWGLILGQYGQTLDALHARHHGQAARPPLAGRTGA